MNASYQDIQAEEELEEASSLFKALSDPARLRILNLLAVKGWTCNCEIEAVTGYGNSKISRHLAQLKQNGFIRSRREGTWIFYSLKQPNNQLTQAIHHLLDQLSEQFAILQNDRETFPEKVCGVSPPVLLNQL